MSYNPFEDINEKLERIEILLSTNPATSIIHPAIEQPITTRELCDFFRITEPTLIRLKKKGKIPFIEIGGSIRFDKAAVIKALEKNKSQKSNVFKNE
ncbi:MAG TPA: helix-turn-helix domain-containing protein [Chitinophagaceae bacterium]|nr:helix-turn-helix domain-containing protein [Chitinophagaceae bacterium]